MRIAVALALVTLWFADARADHAINAVIGDASWGGRTDPGDEVTRVRAHLAFVHAMLVEREASALSPQQRAAREASLADLSRYIERGVFPRRTSDGYSGRHPRFIDDRGVHCAVGQLVADSGHDELAQAINARFEYAHVRDMDAPVLVAWADAHGFTVEELAMIQPSYSPPPTPESVRAMVVSAKDIIGLTCAQKHAAMKSLMVIVQTDDNGAVNVSTKSSDPFAQCFVQRVSTMDRGGHAFDGNIREFAILIDLSFTPPQKLLEQRLANWYPTCSPRPGAIPREANIEITSSRESFTVRAKTTPSNALVESCLVKQGMQAFAEFGAGVWKLHTAKRVVIPPNVVVPPENLKMYAMHQATECQPVPAKGATSTITVTAKPDDRELTITATGSPEFSACMSEALNKTLSGSFRAHYDDGGKQVQYFRVDANVNTSVTITLESRADRVRRNEEEERLYQKMKRERY